MTDLADAVATSSTEGQGPSTALGAPTALPPGAALPPPTGPAAGAPTAAAPAPPIASAVLEPPAATPPPPVVPPAAAPAPVPAPAPEPAMPEPAVGGPAPAPAPTLTNGESLATQMQQSQPALPQVAPAPPRPAAPIGNVSALAQFEPVTPKPHKRGPKKSLLGRFVKTLFMLALLGGLVAGGIIYGPELKEKYIDGGESEPEAPLAFPAPAATPPVVRTATFTVENADDAGRDTVYEVTTDFETRVARVIIMRDGLPDLEVMTFLDDAVIRRVDEVVWYQIDRGQFPLEDQLDRERWVRTIEELIPTSVRGGAVINEATESSVADEPMRRLDVTIDGSKLVRPQPASTLPNPVDPTLDPDVPVGVDGQLPLSLGPNEVFRGAGLIDLELWVDDRGLVRKLVTPEEVGGEVVTVLSTSPDAWLPDYPQREEIEPLTASALVSLGL